ncbi:MAG: hypothetical protein ABR981_05430 [Candidatus Micrarchaeaceae archaeon]|jgi:ABC-type transport system involved in multi-copper enzyme maturation permease subunit
MNPKVLIFMAFMFVSLMFLGLTVVLPQGIIFVIPKLIFLILAVFFDVLAFASRYYTYLIVPLAKQRSKNVIISDQSPYWLASTGECILRKEGDDFIATAYINIPLYVSASEMTDEEKERFTNQVSRLVGISKEPVRFTSELYLMNKDDYIQKLKETINLINNEEAQIIEKKGSEQELEHVRGKLSMWKKMLDNVSKGTSYELGSFATVSAKGSKEFEAITLVQQKARELMGGIAATLNVPPSIAVGNELLKYVEPEYLIPYSTITEQISRNIQQEVS